MRKLILLSGPPQSGKSTAAKFITEALNEPGLQAKMIESSLAARRGVHAYLGLNITPFKMEEFKDDKMPEFLDHSPREWYIAFIQAAIRLVGPHAPALAALQEIKQSLAANIFIYNAGRPEEIEPLVREFNHMNTYFIQIGRDNCKFNDGRAQIIPEMLAPLGIPSAHCVQIMNKYDLDLYRAQILRAVGKFLGFEDGWYESQEEEDEDE